MLVACGEATATSALPAASTPTTIAATTVVATPVATITVAATTAVATTVAIPTVTAAIATTAAATTTAVATTAQSATTAATTVAPAPTTPPISSGNPVLLKVFFSNHNREEIEVYPVMRTVANRPDVATFVMEQLILGPTPAEKNQGYYTDLVLTGPSNCGGKDFSLSIVNKKATLRFCKAVNRTGTISDVRMMKTMEATLKQFPTIETIVFLDKENNCFFDARGTNECPR